MTKEVSNHNVLPDGAGTGRAAPRYRQVLSYLIESKIALTQNEVIKAVGTGNITVNKLIRALLDANDLTRKLTTRPGGPDKTIDIPAWEYSLKPAARKKYAKLIKQENEARAKANKRTVSTVAPLEPVAKPVVTKKKVVKRVAKKKGTKRKAAKKKVAKKKVARGMIKDRK